MIHFVVGTRAQLLKFAPVMQECRRRGLDWRWIHTGQHRDTFNSTLNFFQLPEAHANAVNLNREADTIAAMRMWLGRAAFSLLRSRALLDGKTGKKHIVLTHGDTFSTVLGALYGQLTRTPVMHVESGLRSHRLFKPFPEELNRLVTFQLASLYACPDTAALENLQSYRGLKFITAGNTQIDILRYGLSLLNRSTSPISLDPYAVLCVHRFENLFSTERLKIILDFAQEVCSSMPVFLPLHPVTKKRLNGLGLLDKLTQIENLNLMPRLDYPDFLSLIHGSQFVMTDGGGNQEELYHLGIPTLLLREETERSEGLGTTAVLSGLNRSTMSAFLHDYKQYRHPPTIGSQSPSSCIVDTAIEWVNEQGN